MKSLNVRQAAVVFLKVIVVVFTIVYCCILLEPETHTKQNLSFTDPDSEFTNLQHYSPVRLWALNQPNFFLISYAVPPSTVNLVRTITYQSKARFITLCACRIFYVITTINAP